MQPSGAALCRGHGSLESERIRKQMPALAALIKVMLTQLLARSVRLRISARRMIRRSNGLSGHAAARRGLVSVRSEPFFANLFGDPRWDAILAQDGIGDDQLK